MSKRAVLIYVAYGTIVLISGGVLFRTIAMSCASADASVAVAPARAELPCAELTATLQRELWAWFVSDIKALGPEAMARPPLPGPLREWESLRRIGEARCPNDAARLAHLLNLRRTLENDAYLLSTTAGADIAALR